MGVDREQAGEEGAGATKAAAGAAAVSLGLALVPVGAAFRAKDNQRAEEAALVGAQSTKTNEKVKMSLFRVKSN